MLGGDGYGDFASARQHHLDLIQQVVARLSNEAFIVKGWAVTVGAAFIGFAVNGSNAWLALVAILPSLLFWILDTCFLRSERLFRALYDGVRSGQGVGPFYMSATSSEFVARINGQPNGKDVTSWWRTFRRPTLLALYGAIVAAAVVTAVALALHGEVAPHTGDRH